MKLKLLTSTVALLCTALPAAALTFTWERGCTDTDGAKYSHLTDYGAGLVGASLSTGETTGTAFLSCQTRHRIVAESLKNDDGNYASDVFEKLLRDSRVYSFGDVVGELNKGGFTARMDRMAEAACICDPKILSGAKRPEWVGQ